MSRPGSTGAASTIGDAGPLPVSPCRGELPTWLVAAAIYGGWLLLTLHAALLPWWIAAPALGCIVAWHNSLQHEAIHGHPTRYRAVNDALGMPPLGLWLPFHSLSAGASPASSRVASDGPGDRPGILLLHGRAVAAHAAPRALADDLQQHACGPSVRRAGDRGRALLVGGDSARWQGGTDGAWCANGGLTSRSPRRSCGG